MDKYWKVVENLPGSNFIPGYCTNNIHITASYVVALWMPWDPESTVYVIEFNVDVDQLIEVDKPATGFNQDKSILPGYFGPADPNYPSHQTTDKLEVIVVNAPVRYEVVGAYKQGLSIDPINNGEDHWIPNSNFVKEKKSGSWTTNDLNEDITPEIKEKFKKAKENFKNRNKTSTILKIVSKIANSY